MKFRVQRDDVLGPLAAAATFAKSNGFPILECVMLRASGGRLEMVGSNLEIETTTWVDAEVDGQVCVDASKLLRIAKVLPSGAEIVGALKDEKLEICSNRSRFRLDVSPTDRFPAFDAGANVRTIQIDPTVFSAGLAATHRAMAESDVRYYLNGLFLSCNGESLLMVGSNGHVLSKYTAPCTDMIEGVIIPRGAVLELLKRAKQASSMSIALGRSGSTTNANTLIVELADQTRTTMRLACKLIDGKYPDVDRVWPKDTPRRVAVQRHDFLAALAHVAVMADEKFFAVEVCAADGDLRVSAKRETGGAEVNVSAEIEGSPTTVGFNVRYLQDAAAALAGDTVSLQFTQETNSCLIVDPDDSRVAHVVMPMRI